MQNPYELPTTSLKAGSSPESSIDKVAIYKRTVLPAFIILNLIYVAAAIMSAWNGDSRGFSYEAGAFIGMVLIDAGILYLLEQMANRVTASGAVRYFTIWGFIWRTLIVSSVASLCVALTALAMRVDMAVAKYSAVFAVLSAIPVLLISVVVIWILFSNNRRLQLSWVSRLLGGG